MFLVWRMRSELGQDGVAVMSRAADQASLWPGDRGKVGPALNPAACVWQPLAGAHLHGRHRDGFAMPVLFRKADLI